ACDREDGGEGGGGGVGGGGLVRVGRGGDGKPPAGHYDPDAGSSAATEPNLPAPIAQAQRMPRKHPYVSRRSATPSWGLREAKDSKPGRKTAPRERERLCEK